MIDPNKNFKKVEGEWRYYPYTHAIQPDIFMVVKAGEKEKFLQAIVNEWKMAYGFPVIVIGASFFNPYWIVLLVLSYFLSVFYVRARNEKKYCYYVPYSKAAMFDNYFSSLYKSLDINSTSTWKTVVTSVPLFLFLTLASYFDQGLSIWFFVFLGFLIMSLVMLLVIVHKKFKSGH